MMHVESSIRKKLLAAFEPQHLEIVNESGQHNVPPNSETHFKVLLVSTEFDGRRKVARHQEVYKALKTELDSGVHALALHTYTPAEWQEKSQKVPASPPCLGGE